jgi:PilZ domain-containing protein
LLVCGRGITFDIVHQDIEPRMKEQSQTLSVDRLNKRIHVALPIRVTCWDAQRKPCVTMACTYDISARGARITSLRLVKAAGEVIAIERGRNKALCRVVWVGEPNSELQGQIGIQPVESERVLWDAELRDMEEVYEAIRREGSCVVANGELRGNRRRQTRFPVEGAVELPKFSNRSRTEAGLRNLSEFGCLLETKEMLTPGTDLKMVLNVLSYDLSVRGLVRHRTSEWGVGVEFQQIRKGDRQVLQYLLRKLDEKQQAEAAPAPSARAACASL